MINIVSSILEIIILSSILIAAVLLIRLIFSKKLHTTIVSMLWILVLARLLIPFTFNSPVEVDGLFQNNAAENTAVSDETIPQYNTPEYNLDSQDDYEFGAINAEYAFTPTAANTAEVQNTVEANKESFNIVNSIQSIVTTKGFWIVLLTIWAIGAWLTLFSNGYAIFRFSQKISTSKEYDDIAVKNSLNKAKQTIGIDRDINVLECKFITSPISCGVLHPKILLPKGFTASIDSKKIYMIFLHEISHIKNNDMFKNYLWLAARILYWFNPLVYLAYSRYQDDIEYICDETVLQSLNEQSTIEYTQSLLDAARISSQNVKIPVALSFCKSKSSLRKRVENMLKPQKKSKTLGMFTMLLCAVIVIACFTTACIGKEKINVIDSLDTNAPANQPDTVSQSNDGANATETTSSDVSDSTLEVVQINSEPQPIKSNPVGTEQAALDIARNLNISKTENFSYTYYFSSDDIMPIHDIMVQSDSEFTTFRIYDCNGEINTMQTSVFMSEELGEELPIDKLKQNVTDLAMQIYPNTRLDIADCVRDDFTWEIEGVTHESKDYIVTGLLYDYEDNSVRIFKSKVRLDGGVRYIRAEYSNMDYLMMPDDVRDKVLSYADSADANIELFQIDDYYTSRLLRFTLGNSGGSVTLLESDMSLVDVMIPNDDVKAPLNLPEKEILALVQQYADYYFPENEYVTIKNGQILDDGYLGEGSITFSTGTFLFYILIDDNSNMHKIGIEPNVDRMQNTTDKISEETARENAISELIMECDFVDENKVTVISSEQYKDEYMETYLFNVAYTSDSPSVYNYSFSAQIHIDVYTGEYTRLHIEPVLDELDLLTEDEAIALGRQYIEEVYAIDGDELIFDSISLDAFFVLQYQVNYKYGDKYYNSLISPDTGENVGTGWGG